MSIDAKSGSVNSNLSTALQLPSQKEQFTDLLLLGVIILVLGAESLFYPFGRDQGIHATIAFALDNGLLPYLDIYNVKPPLTTLFHWLSQALFGHLVRSIRIFDLLLVLVTVGMLYQLALRLLRTRIAALIAGVFFGLLHYGENFWEIAQTDGWTSVFVVASMLTLVTSARAPTGTRRAKMFFAGALLGLAVLLKYTIIFVSLPMLAWLLTDRASRQSFGNSFVFLLIGGSAALVSVFGLMFAVGALLPFFEIQRYIVEYAVGAGFDFSRVIYYPLLRIAVSVPVIVLLALGGGVVLVADVLIARKMSRVSGLLLLWAGAAFASGVVQGKGFPYHYLPVHLPMALLAAATVSYAFRFLFAGAGLSIAKVVSLAALVCALIYSWAPASLLRVIAISTNEQNWTNYYLTQFERIDYSWRDNLILADYLSTKHGKDETLFLWGYETGIYYLTNKVPVSRFIFPWPLVVNYSDGRYVAELMAGLEREMPDIFVLQSGDATPNVTGHNRDSVQSLAAFPRLNRFLMENYEFETRLNRFAVYRKKPVETID